MNIINELRNIENRLFEINNESVDLVGAYSLQEDFNKRRIQKLIEQNKVKEAIKLLEKCTVTYDFYDADDFLSTRTKTFDTKEEADAHLDWAKDRKDAFNIEVQCDDEDELEERLSDKQLGKLDKAYDEMDELDDRGVGPGNRAYNNIFKQVWKLEQRADKDQLTQLNQLRKNRPSKRNDKSDRPNSFGGNMRFRPAMAESLDEDESFALMDDFEITNAINQMNEKSDEEYLDEYLELVDGIYEEGDGDHKFVIHLPDEDDIVCDSFEELMFNVKYNLHETLLGDYDIDESLTESIKEDWIVEEEYDTCEETEYFSLVQKWDDSKYYLIDEVNGETLAGPYKKYADALSAYEDAVDYVDFEPVDESLNESNNNKILDKFYEIVANSDNPEVDVKKYVDAHRNEAGIEDAYDEWCDINESLTPKDAETFSKKLVSTQNVDEIEKIINELFQYDKKMYREYVDLRDNGYSIPAAARKVSEKLISKFTDIDESLNEDINETNVTKIVKEIYDKFKARPEIGKYMLDWDCGAKYMKTVFDPKIFVKKRNGYNEYDFNIFHIEYYYNNNSFNAKCVNSFSKHTATEIPTKISNRMKAFMKPIISDINSELSDGIYVDIDSRYNNDVWSAWIIVYIPRTLIEVNESLNEELGQDYSALPEIKQLNYGQDRSAHRMPGISNIRTFIKALENVGKDEFKIRTTRMPLSNGDIRDAWLDLKKYGWSVSRDWDTSMTGFNEVYICKKIK